jgi:hypothetical protein
MHGRIDDASMPLIPDYDFLLFVFFIIICCRRAVVVIVPCFAF